MDFVFIFNSILLGVGLAMDAFTVSLANGLNETDMKAPRMCGIAGTFGLFQAAMPMIGWICVHTIVEKFEAFGKYVPWIALVLLLYIGGKMLIEGLRAKSSGEEQKKEKLKFASLMVMGVATSIDALSVGFTIAEYDLLEAITASLIIAAVTFGICMGGIVIGKKFGTKLSNKAQILGGVILILIGIEIFISGIL